MTITNDNISPMIESAIIHKADQCLKLILEFYKNKNQGIEFRIDWPKILAKIITFNILIQSKYDS